MMEIFEHSSGIATALFATLIHSIWIGAILFIFVRILLNLLKGNAYGMRYTISFTFLIIYIFAVLSVFVGIYHPDKNSEIIRGAYARDVIIHIKNGLNISKSGSTSTGYSWPQIGLIVYLSGVFLFTIRLFILSTGIKKKIRVGKTVVGEYKDLFDLIIKKLNIRKNVRLISSITVSAPALFGYLKPVVIVPAGMLSNLSFEQVEVILLHELVHLKRHDFLVNLFQLTLEVIFFFNPFVWLLSEAVRTERELKCDAIVLSHNCSPGIYAKALLNLSLLNTEFSSMTLAFTASGKKQLTKRIIRILNTKKMNNIRRTRINKVTLLVTAFTIILSLSAFTSAFLTIDRNVNKDMISGSKNVSEYTGDHINNSNRLFSEPVNFNDIGTDTLSESQRQEMIASLESALEELKSTDWDEKLREMEKMHQDMLTSLPEKIKEQQLKIQEELNKIDEETIRKQLQIAAEQMDSIRQNIDMAAIREQMQQEMQNLESQLQEQNFSEQEMRIKIEDAMKQLEKIDFNELAVNIQSTIDSIDFNFDYDFDFDIDSTLENINFKLENIDIEEIKTQVDREIKEIESQIKELKESKVQENTNN